MCINYLSFYASHVNVSAAHVGDYLATKLIARFFMIQCTRGDWET